MAVKLRLTRVGSKKNPVYRIVAADSRSPRDGKFLEIVGRYNPQADPSVIELHVAPDDVGKVIGRQGRIARALRTVVRASAARRDQRVYLEIVE